MGDHIEHNHVKHVKGQYLRYVRANKGGYAKLDFIKMDLDNFDENGKGKNGMFDWNGRFLGEKQVKRMMKKRNKRRRRFDDDDDEDDEEYY